MSAAVGMKLGCHAPCHGQRGCRGPVVKAFRLAAPGPPSRHHHAFQAAAAAAAVAASGTDQLSSQDPTLDSLIDRWLSHKHASTSAAADAQNSSNGSSRGPQLQEQQSLQLEWEALLGPVTVTMTSLATLEEGDEVFALSDSLGHLGSSLLELQQLASTLLLHQQQQQQQQQAQQQQQQESTEGPAPPAAADVAHYTQQLAELLAAATEQATALADTGLLHLLGISTVLLATIRHTAGSSSSSSSSMEPAVQAAAVAAVQAACAELWQRPGVAGGLDAGQLTSLCVILRRLSKLGVSGSTLPVSLPLSAYAQLRGLSEAQQLSGSQLAVCCWCLSSLAVPPPADTVTAALRAAAAAAGSSSGLDDLALRRLLAACLNWHSYLKGQLSSAAGVNLAAAAAEWVESAAQAAVQLSTASSSSSSSSSEGAWKVVASVAQTGAAYGVYPGDDFSQTVARKLLQEQQAGAAAGGTPASAAPSSKEVLEAAAAAGCLVPWWSRFAADQQQQQQLSQAVLQPTGQQQQQLLQPFLAGMEHACRSAAGSFSGDCLQQVHTQLGAIAEHLLASSSSSSSTCTSLLLRAMLSSNCRSQQLPQLCAMAAQQGTAPAADSAAALCTLKPSGWEQQLQQLLPALSGPDGGGWQQLPLAAALALHAATAAAAAASSAAGDVAAAVLRRLLEPSVLRRASAQEAGQLLVVLTVGQAPWRVAAGQQLQAAPPAGCLQLASSSSSSSNGGVDGDGAVAVLVQQQCLRCMGVMVQDGGRSLLPGQVVPVLVSLRYLQQTQQGQQQQQWLRSMAGQLLPAYEQLHREALAAVNLQLQDCAGLLVPSDLAWSAQLLAILQVRPSLALAAMVRAAAGVVGHMQQQDLVWMLWGLTKLQFAGERRLQQQLLSAALRRAAAVPVGSEADGLDEQDWADAAATVDDSTASGTASSSTAELDSDVALLWVAASRGCREPVVQQLLSIVTQHADGLRPAQVAAVLWSFTRMARQGLPQQQRSEVLQLVERSLSSRAAAGDQQALLPRHIAVLTWGLRKLGHQPSSAASACLTAATLQHIQQQQQQPSSSSAAAFLPGEFSCFLYCLADWGVQLPPQQLQQLEVYLQQQLTQSLQAAGASAGAAGTSDSSGGSSAPICAPWDGPAVCSACWALSQLGAKLQPSTLQAAEQYLLRLIPPSTPAAEAAATAAQHGDTTAPSGSRSYQQRRQRQQRPPPAASDLVLFGTACRAAGYQPLQLLQQLRGWLLMQLAQRGPNGLLALQSRAPASRSAASSLAAGTTAAGAGRLQRPHRRAGRLQQQQHAHILSGVLLFLRQTAYADPALLQQLEAVSMEPLVFEQLQWREPLSSRQLVMMLSSFCQLGYVPQAWLGRAGVRCIMRHVLGSFQQPGSGTAGTASASSSSGGSNSSEGGSLSAQDCVQLMQCLAAWHKQPSLLSNTAVRQYILPGLAQTLLGVQHQSQPAALAAAAAAVAPATKQALGEPVASSSSSTGTAGSGAEGPTAGSSTGANLVADMPGWQVVSLLRCMSQLDLPQSGKLFQRLQQQLLRRVQQVWPELGPAGQVAAAHAAGSSGFDFSALLKVQELLPKAQQDMQRWHFSEASAASRLLWVFGNVARHPGQPLLTAALSRVADAAGAAAEVAMPLPLREVSTTLYAATVLQELQHPLAVALVQLLQQVAEEGELLAHPQFDQHAEQLAACLLAAQDAPQAGSTPPPAPVASFDAEQGSAAAAAAAGAAQQGLDRAAAGRAAAAARSSPWLTLPTAVQQRLLEAWRRKVLRKAGKRQGMGEHMQLVMSLRQLGLRGRAKAPTDDGYVCIDVAITAPSGERIAVELLGPHNAALNTQKPLAPARLKWRMLAARGFRVVVVNMWQWRALDSGGLGRTSRDEGSVSTGSGSGSSSSSSVGDGAESSLEEYDGSVMSEKLLYLQARLQTALGPAGVAALSAATRRTRPLPEMLGGGIGVQQQQPGASRPASRRTNLFAANLAPTPKQGPGGRPGE